MSQENSIKSQISHYRIISRIGTGGMGEVYLAEDARLGRKVALKVLLGNHAADSDTRRRFGQEARSASGLNHPNIITIYETGEWENEDYIAMEHVQGQSVRDLITQKKLTLGEAVNIAEQVSSALAAAHAVGIIHRDIKPENVIRRPDGLVKVLDFGLAKRTAAIPEPAEVDSEASTYGAFGTLPGMVMGTVPYMSPEQARGKPVDGRTDIWSLGVVLYEMITGRPPFVGETKSDLLAAILTKEPDAIEAGTQGSREVEHIVRKSLVKDREARYQSVKDMALDLRMLQADLTSGAFHTMPLTQTTAEEKVSPTHGRTTGAADEAAVLAPSRVWPVLAVLMVAVAAGALWFAWNRARNVDSSPPGGLTTTQLTTWKSDLGEIHEFDARFSPDGKLIAYIASKDGRSSIWVKQVAGGEPFTRKQDDSADISPIWSPDGAQIAYVSNRGGSRGIWMAPALGGPPTRIAPANSRTRLVHWAKDGATIYFDSDENLNSLEVATGRITRLTNFDPAVFIDRGFAISPDEKHLAFVDRRDGISDLWLADLDGDNAARLTDDPFDDGTPVWHPDGKRIVYTSDRNGSKQIFVARVSGDEPVQVMLSDSDIVVSDISPDGKQLLFHSEKDDSDLWGVNLETGRESQVTSDLGPEFWPDVSPNGSAIVYQGAKRSSLGPRIQDCQVLTRQLSGTAQPLQISQDGFYARWSPDSRQIAFIRGDAGNNSLWLASAEGGDARQISVGGILFGGYALLPYLHLQTRDYDWSPDSRSIVYAAHRGGTSDIWRGDLSGGETRLTNNAEKSVLYLSPTSSPDGSAVAWLAMKLGPAQNRSWGIWVQKNGEAKEIYQSQMPVQLIGWAADGTALILESAEAGNETVRTPVDVSIFQIDPAGGAARRMLAQIKSTYMHNVVLSPDRRTLAFVLHGDTGDSVETQVFPGGSAKTLVTNNDPRVYFSNLVFAPDGKTLYYGKQANWQVISSINNFK